MTKKTIIALIACLTATTVMHAQTMYRKNFSGTNQLSVEGPIAENGKRTGNWTWWYPSGKVSQQGSYSNGKKSGVWTVFYDDEGQELVMQRGKTLIIVVDYQNEGRVVSYE